MYFESISDDIYSYFSNSLISYFYISASTDPNKNAVKDKRFISDMTFGAEVSGFVNHALDPLLQTVQPQSLHCLQPSCPSAARDELE